MKPRPFKVLARASSVEVSVQGDVLLFAGLPTIASVHSWVDLKAYMLNYLDKIMDELQPHIPLNSAGREYICSAILNSYAYAPYKDGYQALRPKYRAYQFFIDSLRELGADL